MKMHHLKDEKAVKLNVAPESLFLFPVVLPDFGNTFAKINGMASHLRQETHKNVETVFYKRGGETMSLHRKLILAMIVYLHSLQSSSPNIKKLKTFLFWNDVY